MCRHFTIAFVYCDNAENLRKRLRRLLKRAHLRGKYPPQLPELKFYLPETDLYQRGMNRNEIERFRGLLPDLRRKTIQTIQETNAQTFVAVVDKTKAVSTWTQEELYNFAFAQTLIVNIMNVISPAIPPLVVYDKGRLTPFRTQMFSQHLVSKDSYFENKGLKKYRGALGVPVDVPSYTEPGIWAADILAGAFYQQYEHGDASYSALFSRNRIGSGIRLFWP